MISRIESGYRSRIRVPTGIMVTGIIQTESIPAIPVKDLVMIRIRVALRVPEPVPV
jgi:hypothetical protein